jgi:hypothetical protein
MVSIPFLLQVSNLVQKQKFLIKSHFRFRYDHKIREVPKPANYMDIVCLNEKIASLLFRWLL